MTIKRFSLFVFLYIISAITYAAIPSGYNGTLIISGGGLTPEYMVQLSGEK